MTAQPIRLVREHGVALFEVAGEHDVFTAPGLREKLHRAIEDRQPCVVDLRNATFIDSSVLAVLLGGLRRAREADLGYAIVLDRDQTSPVNRIFDVTGLTPVFSIHETPEGAAAAITGGATT